MYESCQQSKGREDQDISEEDSEKNSDIRYTITQIKEKLDPVGSTVRYEMMKLCIGSL